MFIPPDQSVQIVVRFADYTNEEVPYMYHCHLLRHEDRGMMGQFTVVPEDDVDDAARRIGPAGHHD